MKASAQPLEGSQVRTRIISNINICIYLSEITITSFRLFYYTYKSYYISLNSCFDSVLHLTACFPLKISLFADVETSRETIVVIGSGESDVTKISLKASFTLTKYKDAAKFEPEMPALLAALRRYAKDIAEGAVKTHRKVKAQKDKESKQRKADAALAVQAQVAPGVDDNEEHAAESDEDTPVEVEEGRDRDRGAPVEGNQRTLSSIRKGGGHLQHLSSSTVVQRRMPKGEVVDLLEGKYRYFLCLQTV